MFAVHEAGKYAGGLMLRATPREYADVRLGWPITILSGR